MPNTAAAPSLSFEDALAFLREVKSRVSADDYSELITILGSFQAQTIDSMAVVERAKVLFRDHPTLIHGFNLFLPVEYRISFELPPAKL